MSADIESPAVPRGVFRSKPSEAARRATLRGKVPEWLHGDLVRTAPAIFAEGAWRAHHWFDALGLMYAFRIGHDGSVQFRQQVLESRLRGRLLQGLDDTPHFGTPMRRSFFSRLLQPVPSSNDNTNVSCFPMAGGLVAMTESASQHLIDRETLRSTGLVPYQDKLGGSLFMLAHPHADFSRGVVVNVASELGPKPALVVYEHALNDRVRKLIARISLAEVPYMHSFGLTARHAILLAGPHVVRPLNLLWSDGAYIDHFRFKRELGTTIYRVDRASGAVMKHRAPALFVFHTINTFEREGETIHDALVYDDATIIDRLRTEHLATVPLDLRAKPMRFTLRHSSDEARTDPLGEADFEFPAIPYRRLGGSDYRFAWGASNGPMNGSNKSEVIRLETASGKTMRVGESGFAFGEPIFVPRPGSASENEGVLLSVASHPDHDRAALAVIDAETLDIRAWAEVDVPIPLGFHGSFLAG
jgi:carotenoid cleavage dioxygenase-like enzyme